MTRVGPSVRSTIKRPNSGFKKRRMQRTGVILSLSILAIIILLPITLMRLYGSVSLDAFLTRDIQSLVAQMKLILPFGLLGAVSWVIWLARWILSRGYKPTVNNFRTTTSVVIPSYREDPDVLVRCLDTWLDNRPDEVILVVDLADTEVLDRLKVYSNDERVRVVPFKHEGKRSALAVGMRMAKYEIIVLADSDTAWEPGLLDALQMPFLDPMVGAVGTRQNAVLRESSMWRIVADWMINTRYLDYVPLESMYGGVACLSGRTAAYRRSVVAPVISELEYEYFMGRLCVAGDDGRLTWLVLSAGYKTVYQSTAQAWSMFPNSLKAFVKQRVRWSRNSYRCYLTAVYHGWLWKQPIVTQIRVMQLLLTPVTMFFPLFYLAVTIANQDWALLLIGVIWMIVGRGIRSISHLREHPKDILLLPLVTVMIIYIAFVVKLWAFVSMNKQGWLTRTQTSMGGEGQTEASLTLNPN